MKISIIMYALLKMYLILNIYQQSHYHIKSYIKHFLYNLVFYDVIPLFLLLMANVLDHTFFNVICSIYLLCFGVFYVFTRIHLKITKRIIILSVLSLIYIIGLSFIKYIGSYLLLLIEFGIIPIIFIEQGISYLLSIKYLKSANNKLFSYMGNIIAITGSSGKTSTKHLLDQALNLYKPTTSTPKSFNTPLGISKHINSINVNSYDNLILEFGAAKLGDIAALRKIAPPSVAFITDIGYMHMENFRSIDNVIKEKLSILDGTYKAVVNYDSEYIRNNINYNGILITYGLNYGDYQAKNICDGCFDVYYKNEYLESFKCNLIGKYQILNLLGVIAYIHSEGYDLSILKRGMLLFTGVPNRLEIKSYNNITIIDDSYNSNYKGFIEALNILNKSNGKKILLTPGIVELGKYRKELYESLVDHIIRNSDIVILVGYFQTRTLFNLLKDSNLEIYVLHSFKEGYNFFLEISKRYDECSLLIENDVPDIYRIGLI